MGLAILCFVGMILFGLLMWGSKEIFDRFHDIRETIGVVSFVFNLIGVVVCFCVFGVSVISASASYIKKDLDLQKFKNQKSSIVRMLQEDYNSTNLSNAIDFNNKQKMIVVENSTFLFKYSTSYFSVDTIQIPETKFMPTSKLIVEGLESAPE